jgi:organic radical activating enzyme
LNISLIGGEPTLHESMVWFCDELIKLGNVTVEILTNLHKPFDYYYELLNKGIMIASSWHSKQDDLLNFDFVEKIKMIPQKFIDNYQVEVRIMMENNNWENSKKVFKELYTKCKNIMELSLLLTNDGKPYKYTDRQL